MRLSGYIARASNSRSDNAHSQEPDGRHSDGDRNEQQPQEISWVSIRSMVTEWELGMEDLAASAVSSGLLAGPTEVLTSLRVAADSELNPA
jgi:hypothetical protein